MERSQAGCAFYFIMKGKWKIQFNFERMTRAAVFTLLAVIFLSCNDRRDAATTKVLEENAAPGFFPVTNYIYGQIEGIRQAGINPMKVDSVAQKTDTTWLKIEELSNTFSEFLTPRIDSNNLTQLFVENRFEDQTLDAYTFTYTPLPNLPDSMLLQRWDVYVSPATNTVKRIYMVKRLGDNKELQLTWQSDKWCKIVTIINNKAGQQSVSSVQTITWNFD